MNIRLRLTLWYTAILFIILVVFSLIVYAGLSRSLLITTDDHLQREAAQIIGEIKFEPAEPEPAEPREPEEEGLAVANNDDDRRVELEYVPEAGVYWRILDPQGQPLLDPGYFDGASLSPLDPDAPQTPFAYAALADQSPIRLYSAPFVLEQRGAGIIQVAESYQDIQAVQRQLFVLLAISVPLVTLLASVGGWFLASSALNPIDRITRAATQIGASDLSRRLNLNLPDDEVGRLAATFDQMLARLDAAFERQKRFIADASHEMRTPLTILKGEVEVALNRPRTAEEYRETLEQVNQTTNRLTALVEELLLLARADNRQYPLQVERFDLAELLSDEINYLTPRATDKAITLNLAAPDHLVLEADPDKLARLFMNLIDNAIKYSEAGDTVRVSAGAVHDGVRVEIKDTGPGIPAEHLPHLFDRFYRVDKARARQLSDPNGQGGAGLGLSIAQWLAEVHGGRIDVTSHPGHGTTFSVHLPFTPPAEEL